MKNMKNIFYASMLTLLVMSLAACSDEKTYDFPGDPYNRVYLLDNSTSYKIIQTPISTTSDLKFETSLKCTQKASENIRATVEIDNSMIAAYNEKHGTNYEEMPASALVIENATMNIPAGSMAATDTLRLALTENEDVITTLRSPKGYLIPLRLTRTEGGDSQLSTNVFYTYLIVTVTIFIIPETPNVNPNGVRADITGTLVADQTRWSATTNATVYSSYQPLTYLFTTATSSYCYMYSSSTDGIILDINMGQSYTFDGLIFYRSLSTASFASGMVIYTSEDGTTWKWEGELTKASTLCVFYAPTTGQYIRIVRPIGTSSTITLYASCFNIYAK